MSDEAPPTYERDFALMKSWKKKLFEELAIAPTPRSEEIFRGACSMIAFSYENNRNDVARYQILIHEVKRRIEQPDFWANL